MADCNIRNIDPILIRDMKIDAADAGMTLKQWCIEAFRYALNELGDSAQVRHSAGLPKLQHAENCKCFICKPPKEK